MWTLLRFFPITTWVVGVASPWLRPNNKKPKRLTAREAIDKRRERRERNSALRFWEVRLPPPVVGYDHQVGIWCFGPCHDIGQKCQKDASWLKNHILIILIWDVISSRCKLYIYIVINYLGEFWVIFIEGATCCLFVSSLDMFKNNCDEGGAAVHKPQHQWFGVSLSGGTSTFATTHCGSSHRSDGEIHSGLAGKPYGDWKDTWKWQCCKLPSPRWYDSRCIHGNGIQYSVSNGIPSP